MLSKKDKIAVISELRHKYNLTALLEISGIKRSTYYYYLKQFEKNDKYSNIRAEITSIYHEHKGRYGYRRITLELKNRGYIINHKAVQRIMKLLNLKSTIRTKKYYSYRGSAGKVAPNIIQRNFYASVPNQKWTTDITEITLGEEKIYLSPILDMYNSEIISYVVSDRPVLKQVLDMVDEAFKKLPDNSNLILHSDQGWQYRTYKYQEKLQKKGVRQSMSRKGNCLDNSIMENFFGILKSEFLYSKKFVSMIELKAELKKYIDYYNNDRIKSKLKGLSPVNYRIQSLGAA